MDGSSIWVFQLETTTAVKALQPLPPLTSSFPWVLVGDKRRGGLRVVDGKLSSEVALAPVSPPHVHTELSAPSFSSTSTPRNRTTNLVTCMLCRNTLSSGATTTGTCEVWIGWSSGHISILNPNRTMVENSTQPGALASTGDSFPRFSDWDDLLYAHRGAISTLTCVCDEKFVVSCSYDMNVILWEAATHRQIRSLSAVVRQLGLLHAQAAGIFGTTSICRSVELIRCYFPSGTSSGSLSASLLFMGFDGGLQALIGDIELEMDRYTQAGKSASEGPTTAQQPIGARNAMNGVAFAAFSTLEATLSGSRSSTPVRNSVTPNGHSSTPVVVTCATSAGWGHGGAGVFLQGDERGNIGIVSTALPDGDSNSCLKQTANLLAACSTAPSDGSTQRGLEFTFTGSGCSSAVLRLGRGKVLAIALTTANTVEKRNKDDECRTAEPNNDLPVCFSFLVSCANKAIVVVQCVALPLSQGGVIHSATISGVIDVPSPIVSVSLYNCSTRDAPLEDGVTMFYGVCADGVPAAIMSFNLNPRRRSIINGSYPSTHTHPLSVTVGEVQRYKKRLKDAFDLVQSSKQVASVADMVLREKLDEVAALTNEKAILSDQVRDLQAQLDAARREKEILNKRFAEYEETADESRHRSRTAEDRIAHLESELNLASDLIGGLRQDNVIYRDECQSQRAKVTECLVQLEKKDEDLQAVEKELYTIQRMQGEQKAQSAVLASKVVELERLLADTEQALNTHRTVVKTQCEASEEYQRVTAELKARHQSVVAENKDLKDQLLSVKSELMVTLRRFAAAKAALEQLSSLDLMDGIGAPPENSAALTHLASSTPTAAVRLEGTAPRADHKQQSPPNVSPARNRESVAFETPHRLEGSLHPTRAFVHVGDGDPEVKQRYQNHNRLSQEETTLLNLAPPTRSFASMRGGGEGGGGETRSAPTDLSALHHHATTVYNTSMQQISLDHAKPLPTTLPLSLMPQVKSTAVKSHNGDDELRMGVRSVTVSLVAPQ